MNAPISSSVSTAAAGSSAARLVLGQIAAAAALGLVVLYGVAFAESPLAHNAAHDVRHVTVKPCH
ncbi:MULTISPECIES: CbtB domain-containing protein [unclassified Methylibium]|uniref:CbtB domain-containing protein n=1 Tax=unclassified Methylibium TaxID=2633235 RepID=UPI0003F40C96|nr:MULTISPECIES: CbtB domain-containing protein [unclassified Methylibium]EWS55198.1 cobalt transporter subunit CbtB (proposed) [Methylibium sp. T29]EWS59981.1 cobalt transporter subunit CbtB (proposed) [Methylibium sp. T29-B]